MAQTAAQRARRAARQGPAFLSLGLRPFFLCGAVFAALAMPVWLLVLTHGLTLPGPVQGLAWHSHEMIFGYLAAIIAGFILTAVPNWTGRLPVAGWPLAVLVMVWLSGRFAIAFLPSLWLAMGVDAAFLVILAGLLWREVVTGRNWRNVPVCSLVSLFALANILFHVGQQVPALSGYGERLALAAAAMLIGLIGGRITPSFTRNWMARLGLPAAPVPFGRFDQATLLVAAVALLAWVLAPTAAPSGWLLLLAGGLHALRLARWRGVETLRAPIVAVLHLGYLWLAAAMLLLGLAILAPAAVDHGAALHALTAGAIGTMTLAVMTRASLGHTGNEIVADGATLAIYGLVTLGAVLRLAASSLPVDYEVALVAGGLAWSGAFLLFALAYGPILVRAQPAAPDAG